MGEEPFTLADRVQKIEEVMPEVTHRGEYVAFSEAVFSSMNALQAQISASEQRLTSRIATLDGTTAGVNSRIGSVQTEQQITRGLLRDLAQRLGDHDLGVSRQFGDIEERLGEIEENLVNMEDSFNSQLTEIRNLIQQLRPQG